MRTQLLALVALVMVATTNATSQVSDSARRIPDLQVTVTRTPASLSQLGLSVTVLDSDAIHRGRLGTALDEALAFVPGVVAENRFNYSVDQRLSIRGFGARANFGLRGVKVLIDGVPQTLPDGQSQLNNLDLSLVSRIELLRGGASALYGNASGGVLSFTTSAVPLESWMFSVRAEGGTFGSTKQEVVAAARAGTLAGTAAFSHFYTDGFRQQSAAEQRRLSLGLDWAPLAHTGFTLRLGVADDPRARNPGALTAAEYAAKPDSASANNIRRGADKAVTQSQLSLAMHHENGRWRIDAVLYGLIRGLENPLATPPPPPTSSVEGTWVAIDRHVGGLRLSASVDLAGPTVTGGVDVQGLRDDRTNRRSVSGAVTDTLLLDQQERVTEAALFAQVAWPVARRVTIRAGARQDVNTFAVTDRFLADGDASARRTMQATSANGGIAFELSNSVLAWTSIATVFETPTTTELANRQDGAGGFNPDLNPQRSVTEEIGARGHGGRFSFDVAAYHTTTHDAIVPFNEIAGRTYYRNAGSTRTRGVEAGVTFTVRPGLVLLGTWTLTDAIFGEYRIPGTGSIDTLDGHQLAGLPRNVARIGLRGSIGHGFTIDVDQAFSAKMFGDDDNKITIDGWSGGVTGARVAWRGQSGQLTLAPFVAVMNLTDRRYAGSVTTNGAAGRVFEPAAGRTLFVGASVTAHGR